MKSDLLDWKETFDVLNLLERIRVVDCNLNLILITAKGNPEIGLEITEVDVFNQFLWDRDPVCIFYKGTLLKKTQRFSDIFFGNLVLFHQKGLHIPSHLPSLHDGCFQFVLREDT